jgi:hypothetical protein
VILYIYPNISSEKQQPGTSTDKDIEDR